MSDIKQELLTKDIIILLLIALIGFIADFHGASKAIWCVAVALNVVGVALDVWELYHAEK